MEEFGDWIYIIVIIIAGVASLFSSMRKKAQQAAQQNQPREVTNQKGDEGDFWKDFLPQPEEAPPTPPQPKQQARPSYPSATKQPFRLFQEGQPAIQAEEAMPIETGDEQASILLEILPEDTNEWRKAFVYNEIFNRKH